MGRGGARKGAGRKLGSKNCWSREAIARARSTGELPHEFLLRVSRGEEIDGVSPSFDARMGAAIAAAPYFAPKLAQVEQRIEQTTVTTVIGSDPPTEAEWLEQYGENSVDA